MPTIYRLELAALSWLGAALRFRGLFANSFHADEALFASWARLIAVWRDPLLLTQAVDKPPLLFYLEAAFYPLLGPVEWAARLPSFIASILIIPLSAQLTRRLTGDPTAALIAAAMIAATPLAIQFSATAFSDPLLTFWLTAALFVCVPGGGTSRKRLERPTTAGLLFGLALATKYQAILFAPLLVGMGWFSGWRGSEWRGAATGLAAVVFFVLLWTAARPQAGGFVSLQWANIGGLRLARSWELLPRLMETVRLWRFSLGWPMVLMGAVGGATLAWFRKTRHPLNPALFLIAVFLLAYGILHWLWAVPVWDRYLLPVLPIVAVLAGRGTACLWRMVSDATPARYAFGVLAALLVAAQFPVAAGAREGRYPVGGQPGADGGARAIARLLEDAPYGTVLYDHWYSWHWRYQLFDGRVYISWFPHADALVADLAAFARDDAQRYIVLPSASIADPVARRLDEAGYELIPMSSRNQSTSMALYRIVLRQRHE